MALGSVIPVYRLAFALLTLAAIVTQLVSLAAAGTLDAVNYLTYFTVDSNLIATILMLVVCSVVVWLGNVRSPSVSNRRTA